MSKLKKILFGLFLIIIILVLIINFTIIIKNKINLDKIPDFMGYKMFIVLSSSMESEIKIGDLVIVKETDHKKIKENDIIAFRQEDIVITHRVIEVNKQDGNVIFKTKGDNNNTQDDFIVLSKDLEGILVFKVSGLGNIFMFISEPIGTIVVMFGIIILSGVFYIIAFRDNEEDEALKREFEEYKRNKEKNNNNF